MASAESSVIVVKGVGLLEGLFVGISFVELRVEMMNPVSFGQGALGKETLEDIELLVDGTVQVNIELQDRLLFSNKPRFLLYLCRNYDSIRKGESYEDLKASLQIGILNYAPVEKQPEFYAKYRLMNVKTGEPLFTDEDFFGLNVLDLTHAELVDTEDQSFLYDANVRSVQGEAIEKNTSV